MDQRKCIPSGEVACPMGIACAIVSLGGCYYHTEPVDNAEFRSIQMIREVEGVYKNLGEGGGSEWNRVYLSAIIWPGSKVQHKKIGYIEVRAVDGNALQVRAFSNDGAPGAIKEETFVEGRDFEIYSGRIRLKSEGFAFKSGVPPLGPSYEKKELGLDKKGHGKLKEISAGAGLYHALVWIAGVEDKEVRFLKVGKQW